VSEFAYGRPASAEEAVEVVRGVYAAFAVRDVGAILARLAPDAVLHLTGTASRIGRREPYVGHAGMHEYLADAAEVWDDLSLHADDVRAAGEGVVVFGHAEGRIAGEPVRRRAVWVWQVRDGLAVSVRVTDAGPEER
jgi:ketosteroid isomerase-like protein